MNDHQPSTLLAKCRADRIRLIAIEPMKGAFGNEGALRFHISLWKRALPPRSDWRSYANGVAYLVLIVETPVFTRRVLKLMSDEDYRTLQQRLVVNPEVGALIRHSGGLRKVRWASVRRGKRGGIRAITGTEFAKCC